MTVWSRLLYGKLRVRSFDFVGDASAATGGPAVLVQDVELTGPAPSLVLQPNAANVHSLTAITDCAIFDVLAPPYNPPARDATYFVETTSSDGGVVLRRLSRSPPGFSVSRVAYRGNKMGE